MTRVRSSPFSSTMIIYPHIPPSGFNLPPGVTGRDIDRDAGDLAICAGCGREVYADTLGPEGFCWRCRTRVAVLPDSWADTLGPEGFCWRCQRAMAVEDEDR